MVEVHDPRADAAEAKALYGLDLSPGLDGTGFDCLVAAVAHEEYRRLTGEDLARLTRPGGLIADIKGIWRGRDLPAGRRRWQL